MKNRIGITLLALVCVGLAFALIMVNKNAAKKQQDAAENIAALSNKWVLTSTTLEEQRQVAAMYEKDLAKQKEVFGELTNSFTRVSANLGQVSANLAKTESTLQATEAEVKKRDARILELESQNQALDKQALDLSAALTNLTVAISETQRKLAASEGDKALLEKELKRLMTEKAELERQFNDLTVLRAQVAKLKEELSIARRIEWIRQGLFAGDQKGATKLMQGITPASRPAKAPKPSYDLNVEVNADGSVRVIPQETNAPAPPPQAKP